MEDKIRIISRLRKSSFIRSVALVAGGSAAAQAIMVILSPLITRLYGPDAFGSLRVFTSVAAVLIPLAGMGYAEAIVLPRTARQARLLGTISVLSALAFSALLLFSIALFRLSLAAYLGFNASPFFLLLLPLVVLCAVFEKTGSQGLIRNRSFRLISGIAIIQALLTGVAKVGAGFIYASVQTLLWIYIGGHFLHALLLQGANRTGTLREIEGACPVKKEEPNGLFQQRAVDLMREYRDFPIYRMPQQFLSAVSANLPVIILGAYFGSATAGFYGLALTVLMLPVTVISRAFSQVLLSKLTSLAHQGQRLLPFMVKTTTVLGALGLVAFTPVWLLGPQIFAFAFGQEWYMAGTLGRWIAVPVFFQFVNPPTVQSLALTNSNRYLFAWSVLSTVVKIVVLLIAGVIFQSGVIAVAAYSTVAALAYLVRIAGAMKRANDPTRLRFA
ncbi:lipopolysaccharide biosynthesis protein [Alkalispirochaeta alkalica]|uniref:lipopolysaccharide biosynthesis protein n=1 Tax=Alkalispirochaeta alkalica TaxID=46356 RepID=UPI0003A7B334|nr:oligosaccharide flippase family protein [Alkalispirochaeta alkalica]